MKVAKLNHMVGFPGNQPPPSVIWGSPATYMALFPAETQGFGGLYVRKWTRSPDTYSTVSQAQQEKADRLSEATRLLTQAQLNQPWHCRLQQVRGSPGGDRNTTLPALHKGERELRALLIIPAAFTPEQLTCPRSHLSTLRPVAPHHRSPSWVPQGSILVPSVGSALFSWPGLLAQA